jgi:hypothetical protein
MDAKKIRTFLESTTLIRKPKKLLSTFGATRIEYHVVSPIDSMKNKTRLREGIVVSEKPQILTPDALRERFEGFGEDSEPFSEWIQNQFRDVLRALEYNFKNQNPNARVISENSRQTALKIRDDVDKREINNAAVIECPDAGWSLALMHFTLEEAARAFPTNVRDLEQHGLFEPGSNEDRRRRNEIDSLFEKAKVDNGARQVLGMKLREYGLFDEFEDRFLALYR